MKIFITIVLAFSFCFLNPKPKTVNSIKIDTPIINTSLQNILNELEDELKVDINYIIKNIIPKLNQSQINLVKKHTLESIISFLLSEKAKAKTIELFKIDRSGSKSDAFKHTYWNALMVKYLPYDISIKIANAQEQHGKTGQSGDGFTYEQHTEMDYKNNIIGRVLGFLNKDLSDNEISNIIYQDIMSNKNTAIIWLKK